MKELIEKQIKYINNRLEEAKGKISEKDLYGEEALSSSDIFAEDDEDEDQ